MTATTERERPRISDLEAWLVRSEAIRRVAELENNGKITEAEADRRVERLTRHTPDLDDIARENAYEQLREALKRLAHIRSDMFDPADGWRDELDLDADYDAICAIKKLAGPRP